MGGAFMVGAVGGACDGAVPRPYPHCMGSPAHVLSHIFGVAPPAPTTPANFQRQPNESTHGSVIEAAIHYISFCAQRASHPCSLQDPLGNRPSPSSSHSSRRRSDVAPRRSPHQPRLSPAARRTTCLNRREGSCPPCLQHAGPPVATLPQPQGGSRRSRSAATTA